ncbi:MAG TPA: ATP-binding protein [Nocardioidaceae bacterium]|nr:ATP-binding protein [Nocardioidaceae bacterium]
MRSRRSVASSHAEVRMVAQPENVPAARRFVTDALTDWGCGLLAEDIGLCVSELATNATLHSGSTYFQIELEEHPGAICVAVADTGMGSVDVLARQPELSDAFLDDLTDDDACTTGRGMFLVSALATTWGIDELPAGKRVWARFGPGPPASDDEGTTPTAARMTWSAERETPALDPESWPVVRFRECPAALLIAHDENIAEYTRELHLIGDRLGEPSFQQLAAVLAGYVEEHAANWYPARIIAREAVRGGRELVDIDVLATSNIRESIGFLRRLLWEAEMLSRRGDLMTLPAAEPVQRLRDWLEGEFLAQIEDGAPPLPYPAWLAGARR